MKRQVLLLSLSFISFLLAGCLNIEPALSGKARGDYLKSIKPYIEYWEKPGRTTGLRHRDSLACRAGGVTAEGIYRPDFDRARTSRETEHETYDRLFEDWQRCMIAKGYHFTGKCYDNEVGRSSPACVGHALEPL